MSIEDEFKDGDQRRDSRSEWQREEAKRAADDERLQFDLRQQRRGLDAGRDALSSALNPPGDDLESTRRILSLALDKSTGLPRQGLDPMIEALERIDLESEEALEVIKALRAALEGAGERPLALRFSLFESRLFRRRCSSFLDELEP